MQNDRPNRIPWPPIIYITSAIIGLLLGHFVPLPWVTGSFSTFLRGLGVFMVTSAVLVDLVTFKVFRDHKTTVMPHKGATNLITSGPFAWSRNPIYVGNTLLVLGAGLYFGNLWLVILAFTAAMITRKLAIEREENHLRTKFGSTWDNYARTVRRWI